MGQAEEEDEEGADKIAGVNVFGWPAEHYKNHNPFSQMQNQKDSLSYTDHQEVKLKCNIIVILLLIVNKVIFQQMHNNVQWASYIEEETDWL